MALLDAHDCPPSLGIAFLSALGRSTSLCASPVVAVEVALPAGAGSELIFDIGPPPPQVGRECAETGMLIDDLRVE